MATDLADPLAHTPPIPPTHMSIHIHGNRAVFLNRGGGFRMLPSPPRKRHPSAGPGCRLLSFLSSALDDDGGSDGINGVSVGVCSVDPQLDLVLPGGQGMNERNPAVPHRFRGWPFRPEDVVCGQSELQQGGLDLRNGHHLTVDGDIGVTEPRVRNSGTCTQAGFVRAVKGFVLYGTALGRVHGNEDHRSGFDGASDRGWL